MCGSLPNTWWAKLSDGITHPNRNVRYRAWAKKPSTFVYRPRTIRAARTLDWRLAKLCFSSSVRGQRTRIQLPVRLLDEGPTPCDNAPIRTCDRREITHAALAYSFTLSARSPCIHNSERALEKGYYHTVLERAAQLDHICAPSYWRGDFDLHCYRQPIIHFTHRDARVPEQVQRPVLREQNAGGTS